MGLRSRIMLLVAIGLLVATLPLGVMGLGMVRAATDRVLEERLAMTRATAEHLGERLAEGWSQLDQLSARVASRWQPDNLAAIRQDFTQRAPQMPLFSGGIFLMDGAGRLLIQEPTSPPLRRVFLADAPAMRKALATREPHTRNLIRPADGVAAAVLVVPVFAGSDTVVGGIGGVIDLTRPTLLAFIKGLAMGGSGHAAIVNRDGIVLASTDRAELFSRNEHPEFFARFIAEGRPLVGPSEEYHGPGIPGEIHVMAFAPVPSVPWGIGIGQNEEETFGPIRRLRDRIIVFEMAVLVAALLFAWLDTSAVVAPLRVLKEAAERIAGGDLARRVEVQRTDEIGTLTRSFETMRARLVQSLEEVRWRAHASQSLYEVGTEVLSLQDRDAVLRSIAARTVSLLQADVALVCLLDETGAMARISATAGAAAAVASTAPFPVAGSLLGVDCLTCANVDPRYQSAHLAAPLTVGGRHVGALCIGARSGRVFSAEDREVLGGLANLAAIAVENARLQEQVQSVAMLEERERIAREMHDSVGQVLGYVNTKAQAVKVLLESGKVAEAQRQLAQLEQAAREVYADLREAIVSLRTATSPERELIPALREYIGRFAELSGVQTELVPEGDPSRYIFGPATELHLIRIVQEALTNVRKHAMARRAWVRLALREGGLIVTVADDGVGFDPAQAAQEGWSGFGLQSMRERAEAIGGHFSVRRRDGSGTEVEVSLPVPGGRPADARLAGG